MLSAETRASIVEYLKRESRRYIEENLRGVERSQLLPFHSRLMPIPFPFWSQLSERSFSTRSGTWFQEVALRVARQYHVRAERQYPVTGQLSAAAEAHIDALIVQMDGTPRRLPNRTTDIDEVMTVQGPAGQARTERADLFIQTLEGTELYFEMKTPQPNKDTSKAMKRRILAIHALRKGAPAAAYGSCAYNPYGDGEPYIWNYARQFLEIGADFLIGRPFWALIGEPSTYDEMLVIAQEVGVELTPLVRDRIDE